MFRYLVFGGSAYYASGGCYDLIGKFSEEELDAALKLASELEGKYLITIDNKAYDTTPWENSHECEWVRVYDLYSDVVIYWNNCGIYGNETLISRVQDVPVDY